jgi:glucan phosphoethanolaminetransferase (alkaline phosphatase superfamily)
MSRLADLTLTTPALLFPAISLLLLAYTNRFLVIAQLIRELNRRSLDVEPDLTRRQIRNLRKRVQLIKWMQFFGVLGFLLCTFSMACLFFTYPRLAEIAFGISLMAMVVSLVLSLYEISISVNALNIELEHMER